MNTIAIKGYAILVLACLIPGSFTFASSANAPVPEQRFSDA